MMEFNNPTSNLFGLNFPGKFSLEKGKVVNGKMFKTFMSYEGNFFDYYRFLCSDHPKMANGLNADKYIEYIYSDKEIDFRGGRYSDFVHPHTDFSKFEEAKQKISMSKLWKNLADKFDVTQIKRRVRSEHDGEWDYDKRYDIESFTKRQTKPTISRIVKFHINNSYSWAVSAEQINTFGGFIGAIVNLLERNGFLVELHVRESGVRFIESDTESAHNASWLLKKADEYLPLGMILKAFSSIWFRRAGFSMITACAEACGKTVDKNLGQPMEYGKVWEKQGDEIYIYSPPHPDDQDKMLAELIEMIGE